MALNYDAYREFERQLELQQKEELADQSGKPKVKVDEDGTEYEWDEGKKAWFPKFNVDILLKFQGNYAGGGGDNVSERYHNAVGGTSYTDPETGVIYNWNKDKKEWVAEKASKKKNQKTKKVATKRKAAEPTWFDGSQINYANVYVSGLPLDVTLQEFEEIMSKCGIIMINPHTGKPKLKLYKDSQGYLKGDGLCCYLKKESLDLALQLLDDSTVRDGHTLKVQKASFELKGSYDPAKKPKMLSKKKKAQIKKQHEVMLDWKLARKEAAKKSERVIIFKHMFHPNEFDEDATLFTDIRDDLRTECEKFGSVKKVIVFDRHPDGVCSVAFKDFDEATTCMEAMNGRWFAKNKIECAPWDGVTDYQVEETDREREERMKNWENFLNESDHKEKEVS